MFTVAQKHNCLLTYPNGIFLSTEESQTPDGGVEDVNVNTCEKEGDEETKGHGDGNISAPLVLSQERMKEVSVRLHDLEEKIRRLQVKRGTDGWMRI